MSKPFSQACENNKHAILEKLSAAFPPASVVLEIGTCTAQHVRWFAQAMPAVRWLPSDIPANLPIVRIGLSDCTLPNIAAPLALDVAAEPWPVDCVDGIYTANTLHIMSIDHVAAFFRGVGRTLRPGGTLCVYGPLKYAGEFTTPSNARFDAWLKERDPVSGVRDVETLVAWAAAQGLELVADHAMPANNQLLVWKMRTD